MLLWEFAMNDQEHRNLPNQVHIPYDHALEMWVRSSARLRPENPTSLGYLYLSSLFHNYEHYREPFPVVQHYGQYHDTMAVVITEFMPFLNLDEKVCMRILIIQLP